MIRIIRFSEFVVVLAFLVGPLPLQARETYRQTVLVLDQSDGGPFYDQLFFGLRRIISARDDAHTTLYHESFDLSRFNSSAHKAALKQFLKDKYQGTPIGVIMAVGAGPAQLIFEWRDELWPGIPVVFAMLDELDVARLKPPLDVTGVIVQLPLTDSIKVARAAVPDLDTVVFVGDPWERLVVFRNWKDEITTAAAGLNVIEIVGETMSDILNRVAELPPRSAIIYSAVFSNGEGTFYPPYVALSLIAEKANRPIVVAAETFIPPGGVGGYVLIPSIIGEDAAGLVLRILRGERAENIQSIHGGVKPVFNWKQMQRWNVSKSSLPDGSQILFRDATFFEAYKWQSMAVASAIAFQAALILFLLHERHLRRDAELEVRKRMTELAHANRQATTSELSSSIAHELNQPLGSILTNAETGELILASANPNLGELKEILADIKRDDMRAGEVIRRLRGFLKRTPFEMKRIDLNEILNEAFKFLAVQASTRNVALYLQPAPGKLPVMGDPVQLQQVILNLVVNSMDAMAVLPYGRTVIGRVEGHGESSAMISISDSGPGIPSDKLSEVFDPFFTTKDQGMGIGLSIARTIILAHKGQIWVENQNSSGASFHFTLPLAA